MFSRNSSWPKAEPMRELLPPSTPLRPTVAVSGGSGLVLCSAGVQREVAAVDGQQDAGHHRRGVRDEEDHRADDLRRLAEPVQRDAGEELLLDVAQLRVLQS